MSANGNVLIPEEKQAAVTRALKETFGVTEYEDISTLHGGMSSALPLRIVVGGKPYFMRIIMRSDAMADPSRQFATMKTASDAGIAPRILYASVGDRLMISDFVEARPYPADFATRMAPVLRTLHGLPGFPTMMAAPDYITAMDMFANQLKASSILPQSVIAELFGYYDKIIGVYPRGDSEMVACHNDLKPQNTLFDGERIWLVDWEAAFLNDRYADLAVVANFFVDGEDAEEAYLTAYFGEAPGAVQRARFFLMSQLMHVFYLTLFLVLASKGGASVDLDTPAPDPREFHAGLISGKYDANIPQVKVEYAKVHLNTVLENMRSPRFEESLATVTAQVEA